MARRPIRFAALLVVVAVATTPAIASGPIPYPGSGDTASRPGGGGGLPEGLQPASMTSGGDPEQIPWTNSSVAPLGTSTGEAPAEFAFPEPRSWEVTLRTGGEIAGVSSGEPGPVTVAVPGDADVAGTPLRVEIRDRDIAARAGASGFVFSMADSTADGGGGALAEEKAVPVDVSVDYSGFENAYGGNYADRLHVVALPDCVVLDPLPAGCDNRSVPLATRNNRETDRLTARVDDLAKSAGEDGSAILAVTADVGGETGTFGATQLSITGDWQVAPGSGEFNWSYPLSVPQPPGGSAPSLALGYSSDAVDGLTNATNPQGGPIGLGWGDFSSGFIERRYEPCINAQHVPTRDMCWKGQNGTISLGGVNGVMFPLDGTAAQWAVQHDEGWRVERLTGASGNGDNDGEYWKVTATDGTQYFFGQRADSGLQVPVVGDSPGEPCHATSSCRQTWRWMLDRVVDPNGIVSTYRYEKYVNRYRSVEGLGVDEPYNPGAILTAIEYGGRANATAPARVTFSHKFRCSALNDTCTTAPNKNNAASFPDTPNDMICSSACTTYAPVFFNPWRYEFVLSEVRLGTAWKPVLRWNISHEWGRDSQNKYPKMLVSAIQQVGVADTDGDGNLSLVPRPDVDFFYARHANRVDANRAAGRDPMENWRLGRIVNELRGETRISYGHNRTCPADYTAPQDRWDLHTMDCFPQSVKEGNPPTTRRGVFHKYLVTTVVDMPMDGGTDVRTQYTYEDDPAWAYVLEAWTGYDATWAWANWRGYATVVVTSGTSKTRIRVFRGMHKDKALLDAGGGTYELGERDVSITDLDGRSYPDERTLAGRTLQEERLAPLPGAAETRAQSTLYTYDVRVTQSNLPDDVAEHRWPRWAGVVRTTERVYSSPGQFRERRGETAYNARLQPVTSTEQGWTDVAGDERCTVTSYAENPTAGMFNYPAVNKVVAGSDCDTTDPAKLLSYSETAYDNQTVGAAPTKGNPTLQRTRVDGTRSAETRTEFDDWGRPTQVTDPNGAVTRTAYVACMNAACTQQELGVVPTRVEVTNPLNHKTVTDFLQQYGLPLKVTDPNAKVTSYGYDGLGRLETVWLPDAPLAFAEPSFRYSYDMPNRAVKTHQLVSETRTGPDVRFIDTWTIHDGLGRERQTQSQSPTAGKVVVGETTYDERGMTRSETVPQAVTGTPGALLTVGTWTNRTQHGYDPLGRAVTDDWYRSNTVAHTTTTEYTVDTVTVTGPAGNRVRNTTDGLGRTVAVAEHEGDEWVSTAYTYDLADQLTAVTDPAGNTITYTYDRTGRRTSQNDPDRGGATFTYDDAGNQTSVTDGNDNTISTVYDSIGRARERWVGAPQTGTKVASWQYDAAGQLGLLDKEIRHTTQGDWVSDVTGYDIKNRVTGAVLTVPAGIPGLSGNYAQSQTYNRADQVVTTTLPAVGGLPAETLTTTYTGLGMPSTLGSGLAAYVRGEIYDDRGRLAQSYRGPNQPGTNHTLLRTYSYNADQQSAGSATYLRTTQSGSFHNLVHANQLGYDDAGRLTEREVWQGNVSAASWSECYRYDPRQRLSRAYTIAGAAVSGTADCDTAPAGGGPQPYNHEYTHTVDGGFDVRTENGTPTRYEYPPAGEPHPHAPTAIGADTYEWDDAGNLESRTVDGATETFTWDAQQRLTSVDRNGATTSFVYDTKGQRLLRRTAGTTTLYWAGHEITATGTQVTAVRSYGFNGDTIATRTAAGVQYLAVNETGSVEAAATTPGQPPAAQRTYEPYGQVRQESGQFQTDRGFLGQVEDASTNLSYLNARYYDTDTGIFLAPDPLYDTSEPKTLNPYAYSIGNPTTLSDPSGLSPLDTFVLEGQINRLTYANSQLLNEVKRLGGIIGDLQNVIKEQQKTINRLLTYIGALESYIRQQQSLIEQLKAKVTYLAGQVNYWRGQAYYWHGQADYWRGKAMYYKGVIRQLVDLAYLPAFRQRVLDSVWAGRGLPADAAGGTYQQLAMAAMAAADSANWKLSLVSTFSGERGPSGRGVLSTADALLAQGDSRDDIYGGLALGSLGNGQLRSSQEHAQVRGAYDEGYAAGLEHQGGGGPGLLGAAASGCVQSMAGTAVLNAVAAPATGGTSYIAACVVGGGINVAWTVIFG